jgi:type VI secretion system protein ImpC
MKYTMNFGRVTTQSRPRKPPGQEFRIAVLGDLSARANAGKLETGKALADRKPLRVDVDNLEKIFGQLSPTLSLPIGSDGAAVLVTVKSLDDFHPDQLYNNLEIFSELSGLRSRLKNSSTFAAAAKEVQSWSGAASEVDAAISRTRPRGTTMPLGSLSDFARLIGQSSATATQDAAVDELIKQVVAPHIVPAAHPDQPAMIAAVDEALSSAMRQILHHPDFQSLEALWRSVDLMTRELETGAELQIILYDISAEEIAADLSSTDALESTGLYQLLVERPTVDGRIGPPSVLVGNYQFDLSPPHAELLGRIGKVAAAAQAPFIAGVTTECLVKQDPDEVHPLITETWAALRQTPQANYLGLTVPRFMSRWPYGADSEPIDSFEFEEFTPQVGLRGMLWANGSILAGLLLGKTFSDQGLKGMKLGSVMTLGEVPFHYYTDSDGDQIPLPSTERWVSEKTAVHVMSQNFMPVLCIRGRTEIRLGSFNSLAGATLAGPWAPVQVKLDEPLPFTPAAQSATPSVTPTAATNDVEAKTVAEAEAELDSMLSRDAAATSDQPAAAPESAPAASETPDELATLLAELEAKETEKPEPPAGGIDPELAALLAEL